MVSIYTGKKRIEETPKQQKKKVKVPTPEEIKAKIAEGIAAQSTAPTAPGGGTYSPAGSANPPGSGSTRVGGVLYPNVAYGKLKPEFQAQEDVAARVEEQGEVSPLELVQRKTPEQIEEERITTETNIPAPPNFNEILTAIQRVTAATPVARQISGFFNRLRADSLHNELVAQGNAVVQGLSMNLDPAQAELLLNQIEDKLIKESMQVKIQAQYDIPSLIQGTTTELEEKNLLAFQQLQMQRGQAAKAIRTRMMATIGTSEATGGTYRPGLGGK